MILIATKFSEHSCPMTWLVSTETSIHIIRSEWRVMVSNNYDRQFVRGRFTMSTMSSGVKSDHLYPGTGTQNEAHPAVNAINIHHTNTASKLVQC